MPNYTISPEKEKQTEVIKQRLLRQIAGSYFVNISEYIACYENTDEAFQASVIVKSLAHIVLLILDLAAKEFAQNELSQESINKIVEESFKEDTATFDTSKFDMLAYPKFKTMAKAFLQDLLTDFQTCTNLEFEMTVREQPTEKGTVN